MITITKDTIIGDILDIAPQTAPIFLSIGMHCLGCPSSRGETVEEACMVHGVDVDKLLALVNEEANKAQEGTSGTHTGFFPYASLNRLPEDAEHATTGIVSPAAAAGRLGPPGRQAR